MTPAKSRSEGNWTDAERATMVREFIATCPPSAEFFHRIEALFPQHTPKLIRQQWKRRIEKEFLSLFGGGGAGSSSSGGTEDGAGEEEGRTRSTRKRKRQAAAEGKVKQSDEELKMEGKDEVEDEVKDE
ncbi:uncharacterized protein PFL1_05543 [Pseudozyma flocculosa PF-1]|uniref:Myb-like domain-containing protein n=2 Tax=Pseudozyma flocculosa TaxID=84751 RepID=A0A5C3FAR3_9BASI|nr:uncharacterized protein PFL1_05543 [Pseudozyma flocculosa PF-1]EPQ26908.1 hypothetical protein PFL1_05543 [Pseudozyma flocculosa PF-1]SPO41186.1 uncharacterized protein PSFLO_06668 [Pseudozyma flocculosa]